MNAIHGSIFCQDSLIPSSQSPTRSIALFNLCLMRGGYETALNGLYGSCVGLGVGAVVGLVLLLKARGASYARACPLNESVPIGLVQRDSHRAVFAEGEGSSDAICRSMNSVGPSIGCSLTTLGFSKRF